MNEQLNFLHAKLFKLELNVELFRAANPALSYNEEFWNDMDTLQKYSYGKRIKTQSTKLQKLRDKALNKRPEKQYKLDTVLNLSSRQLSNEETEVLALGFNFRPSLPDLPIKDYRGD